MAARGAGGQPTVAAGGEGGKPLLRSPALAAAVLLAVVAGVGGTVYDFARRSAADHAQAELAAIATLKVRQIETWVKERGADAQATLGAPLVIRELDGWLKGGRRDEAARRRLLDDLGHVARAAPYRDVTLLSPTDGALLLTTGGEPDVPWIRERAVEAARQGRPILEDLHYAERNGAPTIELGLFTPLYAADGAAPLAVAHLTADPADFLFPLIQQWPGTSPSAETLLVRRERDEAVFLTALRHRAMPPLQLRVPLSRTDLPAVRAVLGGSGALAGLDYRGEAVLAYALPVAGTPWSLVAKVDESEAYARLNGIAAATAATLALLLFLALWWQAERNRFIAARHRAELARSELELRLDSLTRDASDGILLVDDQGRITDANERMLAMHGYAREEMLGLAAAELRPQETRDEVPALLRRLAVEGKLFYETEHRRQDGSLFPVEVGVRGVAIAGRHYCQAVCRDISERKAAEAALRQALRESEDLYNNAANGYHSLGPDGAFLRINDTELKWLGYQREEIVGRKKFPDLLTPAGAQSFRENFARFVEQGWGHDQEFDMLRKDGSLLPVLVSATAVKDEQGRFLKSRSSVYDLTERKEAERRQERLNRALRLLSECNGALVHAAEEDKLLAEVCRLAVETGGYRMAWVGYAEQDEGRTVRPVGRFGVDEGYLAAANVSWADTVRGRGPTGTAIRSGKTQVNQDFPNNPDLALWREAAAQRGYGSNIALPLKDEGATFGALTIYAGEANAFGGEEVRLLEELAGDLAFGIATLRSRRWRQAAEEKLAFIAHHDSLTDLPNRALLNIHLERAIERGRRRGRQVAVLFADIDGFKAINESLGHATGDEVLLATARRLRACLRAEDTVARWAADEFVVLIEDIRNGEDVGPIAANMIRSLNQPFRPSAGGKELVFGASIGIALHPANGEATTELLRNAESAMFRAKENGRNQLRFYAPEMNADALALLNLEADLRQALERHELLLHYQPKVDLRSGRVLGAEALMRWRQGDKLVSPASFIPLAERTGLIAELGDWAIDGACAQIRRWLDAGLPATRVAVNVSARQFHAGDIERVVAEALARHEVPPHCLELELTESVLMEQADRAALKLDRLRRLGLGISLDDFGTGYSSLAYLRRFPIDTLKLDLSLVQEIVTEPGAAIIAASVIALAHRMGLRVVAEGVETEAQLNYLRLQGCDEMQGYFFSRPVPASDFAEMIRGGRSLPRAAPAPAADRLLLLVDDDAAALTDMRRLLRGDGYRILACDGAEEAMNLLAKNRVQVIVAGQRLAQLSGTEFLGRVKAMYPDTMRIVLAGPTEMQPILRAMNDGTLYKFLTRPLADEQLREHIRDAFRHYEGVLQSRAEPPAPEETDQAQAAAASARSP